MAIILYFLLILSIGISKQPSNQKGVRFLQRTFLSGAAEAEPDKQGKVLIVPPQRVYAGLTKEVVIIGVGKRVEIWDAERWLQYSQAEEEMTVEAPVPSTWKGVADR